MGDRIVRAIEWLLLGFEARLITFMVLLCRILGITTDEVERFRDQQKGNLGPASMTHNPRFPPEPRLPSKTAPRSKGTQ